MFVILPLTLLAQGCDDIAQSTQASIDVLCLFQPVLVASCAALLEPLTSRQVDEVQATLARLASRRIFSVDTEREHGVRARRALVHQRGRNCAPGLGDGKQSAHLRGGGEANDVRVGDSRTTGLGIMLDVMLLLVELALAKKVVDGLIVLRRALSKGSIHLNPDLRSPRIVLPSYTPIPCTSALRLP